MTGIWALGASESGEATTSLHEQSVGDGPEQLIMQLLADIVYGLHPNSFFPIPLLHQCDCHLKRP